MPVSLYMTREPASVREDTLLEEVAHLLAVRRISAMPVVNAKGRPVGVISRRDLLRVGELTFPKGRNVPEWDLPKKPVGEVMTTKLTVIAPSTSVREAASYMLDQHVHRVFIEVDHELRAVLTTRDVMQAIVDMRLETPISKLMSHPVQTIAPFQPLQVARRQLAELRVRGLVVADDGVPLGLFTEQDALAARHHAADLAVDRVMSHGLLVLPGTMKVWNAAAQMASMHAHRIVVMGESGPAGILTPFDLAGAAALS